MDTSIWKKHYLKEIPKRREVRDVTEEHGGRLLRFSTGFGGLENDSVSSITRLLEQSRSKDDPNAFLGLLEALLVLADKKPTIEQLQNQSDAMILFLLGMNVPELDVDSFTFVVDPVKLR